MSVQFYDQPVSQESDEVFRWQGDCFYCGKEIRRNGDAVGWMGATGDIVLHPPCATDLMIRLMRDVHEYQCKTRTHSAMARSEAAAC